MANKLSQLPLRTADQVRLELQAKGVSISEWALANGFASNLVYEVLRGRPAKRGQSHKIAVALGLKHGEVCRDIKHALQRAA